MANTRWLDGAPSFTLTLTPAECVEAVEQAATAHADTLGSAARVRLALALEWLAWKAKQ